MHRKLFPGYTIKNNCNFDWVWTFAFQIPFRCVITKWIVISHVGKISAQPHLTLCIQFFDRANNDKNNTLLLGKLICFTIVWGCAEILPLLFLHKDDYLLFSVFTESRPIWPWFISFLSSSSASRHGYKWIVLNHHLFSRAVSLAGMWWDLGLIKWCDSWINRTDES